jgi:hypothetical protein
MLTPSGTVHSTRTRRNERHFSGYSSSGRRSISPAAGALFAAAGLR